MSGQSRSSRIDNKRSNSVLGRFVWYLLSTVDRKRKFHIPGNIRNHDWHAWSYELDISLTWAGYRLFIIAASAAGTGVGLWQLYLKAKGIS